jgi:SAM-dependent methyltransferase
MVSRKLKALYYATLSPLMRMNALRHRLAPSHLRKTQRAHLGPGQRNYLPGWINVDANLVTCKSDIWADMRFKLPFPDRSLEAIYSHHVVEHLPDLSFHFKEMFRCLRSGGVIRVGGPHGDNAILAMQSGNLAWFGDWPTERRSAGGRFENFIFCRGEHLTILTASFLEELCQDSGFVEVKILVPAMTGYADLFEHQVLESEPISNRDMPNTIVVEARRP